ncbi:CDF family Co(II)/Ni(II) efflux transporter DmeF [Pseudorhodoplanes sinuspersici]|uniref:Cation transporter n=1 Tax=Pseudorhodoplanes sinuspersici TaxID=1235591 RepID=A0A1W6ZZH5_9HYPH|nr:CDF family Co(II)/Ni(II) efflux transporter DmeF [Pseudorhodoplanes sinuspersici]ARQ02764.1 cation transporter [Pseudorhodoplanes sinuspersici]RKE69851.1 cation diffusion facilitator family transporter [Pseudorhodoplanes sinuspersici]
MHTHSLKNWRHEHVFLGADHTRNERRTWLVVGLTASMMVVEIVGGTIFGSMALVADGWHMSTHAAALAIAALAYRFASKHAHDAQFTFGTGKLGELAAFASAMILAVVALLIGYESLIRLWQPVAIRFDQALVIAVIGLAVNLGSAWLLRDGHGGHHGDAHDQGHGGHHHHHHDHNLRGAYLHVLADALTSVLAIGALLAGRFYQWDWMDPAVGIVGALVIAHWSIGLMRASGAVLLDIVPDARLAGEIRRRLESGDDRLTDLHLWRLGPGHIGVIASVVSDAPQAPDTYKARLSGLHGLSHVTVEVHACRH